MIRGNNKKNKKNKYLIPIFCFLIIIIIFIVIKFMGITSNKSEKKLNLNTSTKTVSKNKDSKKVTKNKEDSEKIDENRFKNLTLTNENVGIPVVYYHSVDPSEANEVIISPDKLKQELQYIKDSGYTTLTMTEVYNYLLNNKPIPEKSILITFDDGYMDNYTNAFPILKELNMKATIFLISGGIDNGYYLSKDQIKEMSNYGIDFQSHTVNHKYLDQLSYEQQLKEVTESREAIKKITKKDVIAIAYPYGNYNNDTLKATEEAGYSLAFTTDRGFADRDDNKLELNRIYVSSNYSLNDFIYILNSTEK